MKSKEPKNIIADEIVANTKMLGIAIILFLLSMGGWYLYRMEDMKAPEKPWEWGCSDFDEKTKWGSYRERYYWGDRYKEIIVEEYNINSLDHFLKYGSFDDYEKIEKQLPEETRKEIKERAKEEIKIEEQNFLDEIKWDRENNAEKERDKVMHYCIPICLILPIGGRYLIKLFKWTSENKSSNQEDHS